MSNGLRSQGGPRPSGIPAAHRSCCATAVAKRAASDGSALCLGACHFPPCGTRPEEPHLLCDQSLASPNPGCVPPCRRALSNGSGFERFAEGCSGSRQTSEGGADGSLAT